MLLRGQHIFGAVVEKVKNSPFVTGVTQGLNLALRSFPQKRQKPSIFAAAKKLQIDHSVMVATRS